MAQLTRKQQSIFCGNVPALNNISQFGSLKAELPIFSDDPDTIQALAAWGQGWKSATVEEQAPPLQDMNAIQYLFSRQLAYIFQAGTPEWLSTETYYIGAIARDASGNMYTSLQNSNTNHALTDTSYWKSLRTLLGTPAGVIAPYGGTTAPQDWLMCDGASYVRTGIYANLFSAISTAFGAADGSHFNVPDARGGFLRGVDYTAGVDPDKLTRTGKTGGNTGNLVGSLQEDATAKNALALSDPGHGHSASTSYLYYNKQGGSLDFDVSYGSQSHMYRSSGVSVGSNTTSITLGNGDNETRPANLYVNYIIKL
jgi:microcystin-dependent protein